MLMLWIKAFHVISLTIWFGGLFYLPRLFVYHAMQSDSRLQQRFILMEKNLYYRIMHPAAFFTFIFGFILAYPYFISHFSGTWLYLKLILVACLMMYHFYLGLLLQRFADQQNRHSAVFFRWLNELPTVFLIAIVLLVMLKPIF